MSEQTKIQWCDSTVNFWSGCAKVSPGCANCYAEAYSNRNLKTPSGRPLSGKWGPGAPRELHEPAFELAMKLNKRPWICDECGHNQTTPFGNPNISNHFCSACKTHSPGFHRRRIFSLSRGDWLDKEVNIGWLLRMLHTVWQCREVVWILYTKRPELFKQRLMAALDVITDGTGSNAEFWQWILDWVGGKPPKNVWLLTSVESPDYKRRIAELLRIPAALYGLSCEPLLEDMRFHPHELMGIGWLIAGGESGRNARACNVEWIRSLVNQGPVTGVPVFVKQLGSRCVSDELSPDGWPVGTLLTPRTGETARINLKHPKGGDPAEWPADMRVQQFPAP